jgi:hypothetical protein
MRRLFFPLTVALIVSTLLLCCSTADEVDDGQDGNGQDGNGGEGPADGTGGMDVGPSVPGASRQDGLIPLYVFFDGTEGFEPDDYIQYTFLWDFDSTGVDPNGRHRMASGLVAGHVFERPGTYVTTLAIYDQNSELIDEREWQIVASEFEGREVYVAVNGDDGNSGDIDAPIASLEHAFEEMASPNTRIYFRNGDTFEVPSGPLIEKGGPVYVGTYSDPDSPSTERPTIYSPDVDSSQYVLRLATSDWRIQGLRFTANGHTTGEAGPRHPGGVLFENTSRDNLLIDTEFYELGTIMVILAGERIGVFDSEFHRFGRLAFFGSNSPNRQHSVVGNVVHDIISDQREHVMRIQEGDHIFVGMNHFQGTETKSSIQVRGQSHDVVVYGNFLDRESSFNPQNDREDERVHHCVFDSNVCYGRTDPAWTTDFPVRGEAVGIAATHITVRNNVFYNYGAPVVAGDHPIVGGSRDIWVYNNTMFCIEEPCRFVSVQPQSSNIEVWDNAFINPGTQSPGTEYLLSVQQDTFPGVSNNNLTYGAGWPSDHEQFYLESGRYTLEAWQGETNNDSASVNMDPQLTSYYLEEEVTKDWNLSVADLAEMGQWLPTESSPLIDAGVRKGATLDLYGRLRDANHDIGAIEAP